MARRTRLIPSRHSYHDRRLLRAGTGVAGDALLVGLFAVGGVLRRSGRFRLALVPIVGGPVRRCLRCVLFGLPAMGHRFLRVSRLSDGIGGLASCFGAGLADSIGELVRTLWVLFQARKCWGSVVAPLLRADGLGCRGFALPSGAWPVAALRSPSSSVSEGLPVSWGREASPFSTRPDWRPGRSVSDLSASCSWPRGFDLTASSVLGPSLCGWTLDDVSALSPSPRSDLPASDACSPSP